MTSYGYVIIIMIVVDSCIIRFHFDCIMQLKKSYYIAKTMFVREKVQLLLVISVTVKWNLNQTETIFVQEIEFKNLASVSLC